MEITELQKIKEERTDNYSVDPDNWEKEQEYIHQHKGVFYKNYESWKNHVKSELLEYIDKVLRYKPIEDDTKLGGKVLSALGISKDLIFFGKPTNLLKDTDTIFEIGCGAGAFIYPFFLKGHKVGGIDYSKSMVNLAKITMPGMVFESKDAVQFEMSCKYDIVLSNSVFQYFDSFEYAKKVIHKRPLNNS